MYVSVSFFQNNQFLGVFMGSLIINISVLATMLIGLGIAILTILNFYEKRELFGGHAETIIVFLPLIYSLLSVSMLVIGNIYLYFLLAIWVYFYVSQHIGAGYFFLTTVVIIVYLRMLKNSLSLNQAVVVVVCGFLTYAGAALMARLKAPLLIQIVGAIFIMLCAERLFGALVPTYGVHTLRGSVISVSALLIATSATHYFHRYITQRVAEIDAITLRANKDELTQFYNLYYLYKDFGAQHFNQETLAIAILDLDYFKRINDQYGHNVGNEALIMFSKQIHQNLIDQLGAENFELYRYGGEEFVVTMKKLSEKTMSQVFDNLQEAMQCVKVAQVPDNMSFSAGVAYLKNHHFEPMKTLEAADQLLYQSKHAGRKQTTIEAIDEPSIAAV